MKLYTFRAVLLPIIRSLFNVHSALVRVYVIQVWRQLSNRTTMELQFHRGPARRKFFKMHGHMNVKFSQKFLKLEAKKPHSCTKRIYGFWDEKLTVTAIWLVTFEETWNMSTTGVSRDRQTDTLRFVVYESLLRSLSHSSILLQSNPLALISIKTVKSCHPWKHKTFPTPVSIRTNKRPQAVTLLTWT